MFSKQKIKEFSKYKLVKILEIISDFCQINLGKKKRGEYPEIKISFKKQTDCMGLYDPVEDKIIIYVNRICTISDLTTTIIHEWCHSKQDVLKKYQVLYKKFGYSNHPMELEAQECEKIWNRKCLYYLRNNFCKNSKIQ